MTNVDALIAGLVEGSPEERRIASEALVKIGSAAVPALRAAVSDDTIRDSIKFDAIADVLAEIGAVIIPDLILLAVLGYDNNPNPNSAWIAAAGLGRMGPAAMPALIAVMSAGSKAIADAFRKIGAPAVPALIAALNDIDEGVRFTAASGLSHMKPDAKDAAPALIAALADQSPRVRSSAAWALASFASPPANGAVTALMAALRDEDQIVRWNAVHALTQIGEDAAVAVPALMGSLCDEAHHIRWRAVWALGRIGPPAALQAVPAMIATRRDESADLQRECLRRRFAAEALRRMGPPAVPDLIAGLREEAGDVRWVVARALGLIGPAAGDAVPALIDALDDRSHKIRSEAAQALGKIGSPAAVPALLAAMIDETEDVRSCAAEALRQIGPGAMDAVPAMIGNRSFGCPN